MFPYYVKHLIPLEPGDSDMDADSTSGFERPKPMQFYRDFTMDHWAIYYLKWARIVGTEQIASPIYFSFISCLTPPTVLPQLADTEILSTAEEDYYSEVVSQHFGAMYRIYNDLGSIPRGTAAENFTRSTFPS
ncbi:hypothetical protein MCOR24_010079 [Pyricularia oryzae]|nr:hypothetical protein MCOR24_010079 [Pyricularia oryzae]